MKRGNLGKECRASIASANPSTLTHSDDVSKMKIEDIEREMREVSQSLKDADQAFNEQNYARAEPLYCKALALLERTFGEEHSDTARCLQTLGDTYFALKRYGDAVPIYLRVSALNERMFGQAPSYVAATHFKLAKSFEKLGKLDQAETFYRRALIDGEKAEGPMSAAVALVLESFAGMLKRARLKLDEADAMLERARSIREKSSAQPGKYSHTLLEQLADTVSPEEATKARQARAEEEEEEEDGAPAEELERSGRLKFKTTERARLQRAADSADRRHSFKTAMIVLVSLVVVVASASFLIWQYAVLNSNNRANLTAGSNQEAQQDAPATNELSFRSPDGTKQLYFKGDRDVLLVVRGSEIPGTYTADDSGMVTIQPKSQSISYMYQKVADGLSDEDGTILYESSAPEWAIIKEMKVVAMIAQRYYRQIGQYPDQAEHMFSGDKRAGYQNPFTGSFELPQRRFIVGQKAEELNGMSTQDFETIQKKAKELKVWKSHSGLGPGVIEFCHVYVPEGETFYIRGSDRAGELLHGSEPGSTYMLTLVQGMMKQ